MEVRQESLRNHTLPSPNAIPTPPVNEPGREFHEASTSFRFNSSTAFLTYPRTSSSKKSMMEALLNRWKDQVTWAIIAEEQHLDGTPHLHLVFQLDKKQNSRDPRIFDLLGEHPNITSPRSMKKVIAYVRKSDRTPLVHGAVPYMQENAASGIPKSTLVANDLISGLSIREILAKDPGYVMINLQKIQTFQNFLQATQTTKKLHIADLLDPLRRWIAERSRIRENPEEIDLELGFSGITPTNRKLFEWLCENLPKTRREFKQKQLWIWGPPNTRKTSFVRFLERFLKIYTIPHEPFDDLFYDDAYDMAFCDEWLPTARETSWLNGFVQGGSHPIRVKGTQRMKTDNIPVIIASNFPISLSFKNDHVASVETRFLELHFTDSDPIEIDFLWSMHHTHVIQNYTSSLHSSDFESD